MRFSKLLTTAGMFTTAIASGTNIVAAIKKISDSAITLKSTAASWDGNALSGLAIGATAENLLSNTNAGINVVNTSPQLSDAEAAQVAVAIKELANNVDIIRSTIIVVKPKVVALGIQAAILNSFQQQRTASQALAAAVVPKMPASRHVEALAQIQRIDNVFAEMIQAHS